MSMKIFELPMYVSAHFGTPNEEEMTQGEEFHRKSNSSCTF